ncbi:MAG: ribonuclease E/G [Rhodobacteraceae bacterium]|nr:ribonuclease E/G [Paracoccaceae bacterium]
MKGRVIVLDRIDGRPAAALMVDGRLEDFVLDPPRGSPPVPGTIFRGVCDRPMKGQGGMILRLPDCRGFLRGGNGLRTGASVLVQVTRVGEAGKAVPVSGRILFRSRYAIITPGAPGLNIARSIRDAAERDRLRALVRGAMSDAPERFGAIMRSAAEGVDGDVLVRDIARTRDLAIAVLANGAGEPECLVEGPTAHKIAWRDWATPAPDDVRQGVGSFADAGVLEAVDALRSARVPLCGGAHAMIEPTAALVAVDVNTGAGTSPSAGVKANLALARDLPRQLRLRGLGGQITLDLAPMPKKDRRGFEDALRRALRVDGTDTVLAGWTPLGHFELQRKRDRFPLKELWFE